MITEFRARVAAASYLKKWVVLGVVIGAVAGCGAIIFYEAEEGPKHNLITDLLPEGFRLK